MVGRWGMSEAIGPLAVAGDGGPAARRAPWRSRRDTQELIDERGAAIAEEAHEEVLTLLRGEPRKLDALAEALLERETLDEDDAYAAAGIPKRGEPAAGELAVAAQTATAS